MARASNGKKPSQQEVEAVFYIWWSQSKFIIKMNSIFTAHYWKLYESSCAL